MQNIFKSSVVLVVFLILIEIILRLSNPNIFEFIHQSRQVFSYSPRSYVDLEPNRSAHLLLKNRDGQNVLNFVVSTNSYGFRTFDTGFNEKLEPLDRLKGGPSPLKFVHTIGDSFTMGWGVAYRSSYPAILDGLLGESVRVLNLGVPGYGAIAATKKSKKLWQQFPPKNIVYFFSTNDIPDDEKAIKTTHRIPMFHSFMKTLDFFRKNTYLANIPFAIKWSRFYRASHGPSFDDVSKPIHQKNIVPEKLLANPVPSEIGAEDPAYPTFVRIKEFAQFAQQQNIRLVVMIPLEGEISKKFYFFCRKNQIEAFVISMPEHMKIPGDGHFNHLGNYNLAYLVQQILTGKSEKPN